MPEPYSLEAEEALVASLLVYDTPNAARAFAEFQDQDLFYEHLRPIAAAARATRPLSMPAVLLTLGAKLDDLQWRGLEAEELIYDIIARYAGLPSAFYAPAMAGVVHQYAEQRRAYGRARQAAQAASERELGRSSAADLRERFK